MLICHQDGWWLTHSFTHTHAHTLPLPSCLVPRAPSLNYDPTQVTSMKRWKSGVERKKTRDHSAHEGKWQHHDDLCPDYLPKKKKRKKSVVIASMIFLRPSNQSTTRFQRPEEHPHVCGVPVVQFLLSKRTSRWFWGNLHHMYSVLFLSVTYN